METYVESILLKLGFTFATRSAQLLFVYPGVGSPTPTDKLSPTTPNRRHRASNSNAAAVTSA
ncbi:hypothetical protein [Actinophytocola sp.]|uniref:hypothetical protein n=1 Tax=Actinophytocola sp. TaxID=1872138 RepID=UPI003899940C